MGPLPILPLAVAGNVAISLLAIVVEECSSDLEEDEATGRPSSSCNNMMFLSMKSLSLSMTKGLLEGVSVSVVRLDSLNSMGYSVVGTIIGLL